MQIQIAGVHTDVGPTLETRANEKVSGLSHYFDHITDANVMFKLNGHGHEAHVTMHANGVMLRAVGTGKDYYIALDDSFDKLVKQLKKYKGRLNKHRTRREKFEEHFSAISALEAEDAHVNETGLEDAPENMFAEYAPEVAHKEVTRIAAMSVDEAVMQMDLLHKPAYMFLNAKSGKMNMVYREAEGKVRWISPK
jgi:putative sigma-54 modulation protein